MADEPLADDAPKAEEAAAEEALEAEEAETPKVAEAEAEEHQRLAAAVARYSELGKPQLKARHGRGTLGRQSAAGLEVEAVSLQQKRPQQPRKLRPRMPR